MHLQKFWINFVESSVMMTTERHFGRPDGVKLTLERCSEQPCGPKLALKRRFGSPGGVKLALERRLGGHLASSWPWNGVVVALGSWCKSNAPKHLGEILYRWTYFSSSSFFHIFGRFCATFATTVLSLLKWQGPDLGLISLVWDFFATTGKCAKFVFESASQI